MSTSIRPYTTLFLLTSVDRKISSGSSNELDVDSDWKKIVGVREGLQQYYDLEKKTDLFSMNSGRTWAKIGYNERQDEPDQTPVTFIVIDSKPHLKASGIKYAAKRAKKLLVVTSNSDHPAFEVKKKFENISILHYPAGIDFTDLMKQLKLKFEVDRLTLQTGGILNSIFLSNGLIDRVLIIIAPLLVGGRDTPSLVEGISLNDTTQLSKLKTMALVSCTPLSNSYVQLEYRTLPETIVI